MINAVAAQEKLTIIESEVIDLIIEDGQCRGVIMADKTAVDSKATIITAGTFLNGLIHIGLEQFKAGRIDEPPALGLTEKLISLGIQAGRLKTGTPPRLDGSTIDFGNFQVQDGDDPPPYFSNRSDHTRQFKQSVCYLAYTNRETHEIIRENLGFSPLYAGIIKGIGPRYCPSIEDKVVRFADKPRHQLFLEPEGLETDEYYINGFSSSLPEVVQLRALRTISGLERVEMTRPGYAVEYDFFPPHQLYVTMESKIVPNLYFAGQVNGTSGYEEAAAQGIMAGINAVLRIHGEEPFRLLRSEAYVGVLLDDLVTKSTSEPYRMFTSRAEYRLKLRDDNADDRLLEKGYRLGLVRRKAYDNYMEKRNNAVNLLEFLKLANVDIPRPADGDNVLKAIPAFEALRNSALDYDDYPIYREAISRFGRDVFLGLANDIRYDGYIRRQDRRVERLKSLEDFKIPSDFRYSDLRGLKIEAREKLSAFRPETVGQASRISGVSPGDISVLMVHLKRI